MCIDKVKDMILNGWPGLIGALLSLHYTKPLCFFKGLISFIGGATAAIVIAPAVASDYGHHLTSAMSFLIGTFSMSIIGIVFQVIDRFRASPIHTLRAFVNIVIDVLLAFRHGSPPNHRFTGKNDDTGGISHGH